MARFAVAGRACGLCGQLIRDSGTLRAAGRQKNYSVIMRAAPDDYCSYNYNNGDDMTPAYRRLMSPAWQRTASVLR